MKFSYTRFYVNFSPSTQSQQEQKKEEKLVNPWKRSSTCVITLKITIQTVDIFLINERKLLKYHYQKDK